MSITCEPHHVSQLRQIVENHSMAKVDCPVANTQPVDAFSASAFIAVYDGLNEKNKAHMASLPVLKAVDVAFKLINKK